MTRKGKIGLGIALGIGVLSLVGWQALRPKIGSAPMAELKKLIDPRLLDLPEPTPDEEARWKELITVLSSLDKGSGDLTDYDSSSRYLLANRDAIARMHRLLDAGVSHSWLSPHMSVDYGAFSHTKSAALAYRQCAQGLAANGEYTRALDCLGDGYKMLRLLRASESSYLEHVVNTSSELMLNGVASEIAKDPKLPQVDASRLVTMIPEVSAEDKELQRAIKGEFRGSVLSWIDDPKLRLKNVNMIQVVSGSFTEEQKNQDLFGNYNPYETAKLASDFYMILLENTSLPIGKISTRDTLLRARIDKELPAIPDFSSSGFRAGWAEVWYKAQMNSIGNSLGMLMLYVPSDTESLSSRSFQTRTHRELVRALAAINLYRKRHGGRAPRTLETLELSGILKSVPHDYFADKPLSYDPSRGVVYSVGRDRKDDLGSFTREGGTREPDFGYRLR